MISMLYAISDEDHVCCCFVPVFAHKIYVHESFKIKNAMLVSVKTA